jgi:hypothetical protein
VAAVADHHVLDHLVDGARIDADAAHGDPFAFARAQAVDFEGFAGLQDEGVFQALRAQVLGVGLVLGQLPVLAEDGTKKRARTR